MLRFSFLLLGCVLIAAAAAEPYVHPPTQVVFPDEIAGLPRGTIMDYEAKSPGLGVSVRYQRQFELRADVFVYNFTLPSIPADLQHPLMARLRQNTDREIVAAVQKLGGGTRRGESLTLAVETPGGQVPVFFDSYVAIYPTGVESTFVWLWPARNHFFKIRLTRKPGDHDPKSVRDFYEAIVRLTAE